MAVVTFQIAPHQRDAGRVRELLVAQHRYEQVRAVRHGALLLLAAAGGVLWCAMRGAARPGSALCLAGLVGWVCLLGVAIAAGALELLWWRRRDRAAAALRR